MSRRSPRYLAVTVVAFAVVVAWVPLPPAWVEQWYSRQVYLVVQPGVTRVSSLVGFSMLDPMLVAGLAGLGWWWWRALRRAAGRRGRAAAGLALTTAALAAGVYLVFVAAWGLNYRRVPLTAKLDYQASRISTPALAGLSREAVGHLNRGHRAADGRAWPAFEALPGRFGPAFTAIQRRLGGPRTAVAGRPKTTLLSAYFERAGIDGMMNPFSLEVLVNRTLLPYERPFTVAHEWAHLAGYANEAEASFVGFLVCLAGDEQSRYSAWLFLLPQLVRHLDRDARAGIYAALDDPPRRHLTEIAARHRRAVPIVRRQASRVYDRFLRANRVDGGIASYGLVVDLLLGTDGPAGWRGLVGPDGMISPAFGGDDVQTGDDSARRRSERGGRVGPLRIGGRGDGGGPAVDARASARGAGHDRRRTVAIRGVDGPELTPAPRPSSGEMRPAASTGVAP